MRTQCGLCLPKRKREAIQQDLRALEEILRHGKAVDGKPAVVSAGTLLAGPYRQQPAPVPCDALEASWLGHGLRRCVKENRPGVVHALLQIALGKMCAGTVDVEALLAIEAEVFKDFPQLGGRPVSKEHNPIYQCWLKTGRPRLTSNTLAWKYYGLRFERAVASERRRLRNQCRAAVMRAQNAESAKMARNAEDIFP